MTKLERSYMLMGASFVLLILTFADMMEGTWGEIGLKSVAILFVVALFVRLLLAPKAGKP